MTNDHEFTVEFVTPDNVEEENVLLVLREFFGDLIQTDRFIDARVRTDDIDLNESERERLLSMLSNISDEDVAAAYNFIEEIQSTEE